MKRVLVAVVILLLANCAVAQNYEAMLTRNGTIVYLDDSGAWLPKNVWVEKYGRKAFKAAYPDREYYSHIQEVGFIRTNYRESVYSLSVGDIRWSRVFDCSASVSDMRLAAKAKFSQIIEDRDDCIIGIVEDIHIVEGSHGLPYGFDDSMWSGVVRYDFKGGRYRVTVESIRKKSVNQLSASAYIGLGVSVGVDHENTYESIYPIFFVNGKKVNAEKWGSLADCVDHNLSSYLFIHPIREDW